METKKVTPASKQIRELYRRERAEKRGKMRFQGAMGVVSPIRTSVTLREQENLRPHESVSNGRTRDAVEPEFGTMGPSGDDTLETALPPEEASGVIARPQVNGEVDESILLDAYWASFGDAGMRAALRSDKVREAMLEVVIGEDNRIEVGVTDQYPWRCIASLLITAADGSNWIGTAWLASPRLLLTAGHCVYIHDRGGWVQQIEVIPGRRGSEHPNGSCIATDFRSVRGWTESADRDFDYAAILLPENCRLGDQLGWFGLEVRDNNLFENLRINIAGYPGDKPAGTQWFHSNVVTDVDERVVTYEIDTAGGQSGAPVWVYRPESGRYAIGIHTNGSVAGNSATRITSDVFDNIIAWRDEVP